MATRAEQYRYEAQRSHPAAKPAAKKTAKRAKPPAAKATPGSKGHAARKATVAREEVPPGARPSRKSTRKSENRAKTDANVVLTVARERATPESRFRQARDKAKRARGS